MPSFRARAIAATMLLAVSVMLLITPPVSATTTDPEPTIDVIVYYANYDDMDGDGMKDDVYVVLVFILGYHIYYEFGYVISLELPSGLTYSYTVYVIALSDIVVTHNVFYNHATESGDYTVYVSALLITPGHASAVAQYTFDPPGGSEGGKPTFGVY